MSPENTVETPEWITSHWFNTPDSLSLNTLKGNIVAMVAFQMLCPGCVAQAIPQMKAVDELFSPHGVKVVGLHTVFEHHDAMTPTALEAFLHEYRICFPVGVDAPGEDGDSMPQTMRAYRMKGTPTLLLYGRDGRLQRQFFGYIHDLRLGAEIMALLNGGRMHEDLAIGVADGPGCPTGA